MINCAITICQLIAFLKECALLPEVEYWYLGKIDKLQYFSPQYLLPKECQGRMTEYLWLPENRDEKGLKQRTFHSWFCAFADCGESWLTWYFWAKISMAIHGKSCFCDLPAIPMMGSCLDCTRINFQSETGVLTYSEAQRTRQNARGWLYRWLEPKNWQTKTKKLAWTSGFDKFHPWLRAV